MDLCNYAVFYGKYKHSVGNSIIQQYILYVELIMVSSILYRTIVDEMLYCILDYSYVAHHNRLQLY